MSNINVLTASKIDKEIRELSKAYSVARIKIGLELAKRLKEVNDSKLYILLDEKSYPSFAKYIESINLKYPTVMELIRLYESYVLIGGYTIEELSKKPYNKLTIIKPYFFDKEDGEYKLSKPKSELKKWINEIDSDISVNDLRIKRKEAEVGEHNHSWLKFKRCKLCGITEFD